MTGWTNKPLAITVWKNGDYKLWGETDAHYAAASDPNWLVTIPLPLLSESIEQEKLVIKGEFTSIAKSGDTPVLIVGDTTEAVLSAKKTLAKASSLPLGGRT